MSERDVPPELRALYDAERGAPPVDASTRSALRARLAESFTDLDAPARATAQEPLAEPPPSHRKKGNMNFFDKRIIGVAGVTAAAASLLAIAAYKRIAEPPAPPRHELSLKQGPMIALGRSFAGTPAHAPVAPRTKADLAITAGENAWIHAPFGAVDIEIQSSCNAEVQLWMVTRLHFEPNSHRSKLMTDTRGGMLVGIDSPDGRSSTYHFSPGLDPDTGMYEYTSQCVGQPPIEGMLVIDRVDAGSEVSGSDGLTNAEVYSTTLSPEQGVRVLGTVLQGARVSIGAKPLALKPSNDAPLFSTFAINVRVPLEHPVVSVRVDDPRGTHFYVVQSSGVGFIESCATTMIAPKQEAATLDAQGDHAGALAKFEAALEWCKPDRETLSLALEYACRAGNVDAARKYWRKLPPELQRKLEPMCAQNAITRDALDKP